MCEDNAISVLWDILLVLPQPACERVCVCELSHVRGFLKEPQIWANELRLHRAKMKKPGGGLKELLRWPFQWWVAIGFAERKGHGGMRASREW